MSLPARNGGTALTAVLTVVSLVAFLFTVAAAYVSNQQGISRLDDRIKEVNQTQDEIRRELSVIDTDIARLQALERRGSGQ